MSGGRGGRVKSCVDFKLGACDVAECPYAHTKTVRTAYKTVQVSDKIWIKSATKGDYVRRLREIVECSLRKAEGNKVDIVVEEKHKGYLCEVEREYRILLAQLYSMGPGWCYIHKSGLDQCEEGASLEFKLYTGKPPLTVGKSCNSPYHELHVAISDPDLEIADKVSEIYHMHPSRESETKEGLHSFLDRVFTEQELSIPINKDVGVKIVESHGDHMKDLLEWGLEWFCNEKRGRGSFALKLEARFGKILWRNVPEDAHSNIFRLKKFANFCFSDTKHARIFKTIAKEESVDAVKDLSLHASCLETFDIKFTNIGCKMDRFDVRVTFESGRPRVLIAKRNEAKILMFDILCLHRDHDLRLTLNCYEVLRTDSPEYEVVAQLVETLSLSDTDNGTIRLKPNTDSWSVYLIRHKKRSTYQLVESNNLLTVTEIREYKLEKQPLNAEVSLAPDSEPHIEIELHNCSWECAFGQDVGFSPEECLVLHMASPEVLPGVASAIPCPWKPENISDDLQDYLDNLDTLNELL